MQVDAAQGGDTPVPDIASAPPTISADGLTYDFTLKDNVMWAPPLSRAVTKSTALSIGRRRRRGGRRWIQGTRVDQCCRQRGQVGQSGHAGHHPAL